MSRCFPFPPPGYDKKIKTEEAEPLIKEKDKEKKHKKDKDKEKKESKEKKNKDRSKDKEKEKKEKKEKRKDRKDKDKRKPLEEKKTEVLPNSEQNNTNGESKYIQDLARRISYQDEATGSHSAQNISHHPNEETKRSEDDHRRINTQKTFAVTKTSENAVARVSFGADHKRAETMGKPKETIDHTRQIVTKSDKEGIKKHEGEGKDRYKEKKEEKKAKGFKLEEREKDSLDIRNPKPPDLSRVNGNIGKRKDHETNGFLYENGTKPNKLQRNSVSVSSIENGRLSSAHQTPPMVVKEVRVNGFVDCREKQNGEASKKPPHRDLKYLEQILNVPKRELLQAIDDDQNWLCGQSGVKLKKTRIDFHDSVESLQVWNQAFRIDCADIVALPYVVPF